MSRSVAIRVWRSAEHKHCVNVIRVLTRIVTRLFRVLRQSRDFLFQIKITTYHLVGRELQLNLSLHPAGWKCH